MSIRRASIALIATLCLATACARAAHNEVRRPDGAGGLGPGSPAASAPNTPASASPAPSSPIPVPTATTTPPAMPGTVPPSTDSNGDITIAGTVHVGAEPGCLLLTSDKIEYLLESDNLAGISDGRDVTVTGHIEHGVMSHCMQGMPFKVTKLVSSH
jgi:hypothetical protein